jgi:diacylglycerol kinase
MSLKKFGYNLRCALRGLLLNSKENSFQLMLVCAFGVIILGILFKISLCEWLIVLLCISFNLALESINTTWETTFDYLEPKYSLPVKNIKDLIASSVLIVSIFSAVIGIIIFVPKIINFLKL